MKFNDKETIALEEAIRYYRSREGNYSSSSHIVDITGKLSDNKDNEFSSSELNDILSVISENSTFLKKYSYPKGLTAEQSKANRDSILIPLEKIKVKINKVL
jgi:CRISPR/Cas system CSM-associated protein Csm5 (group 7 of RAMP superfamily)